MILDFKKYESRLIKAGSTCYLKKKRRYDVCREQKPEFSPKTFVNVMTNKTCFSLGSLFLVFEPRRKWILFMYHRFFYFCILLYVYNTRIFLVRSKILRNYIHCATKTLEYLLNHLLDKVKAKNISFIEPHQGNS